MQKCQGQEQEHHYDSKSILIKKIRLMAVLLIVISIFMIAFSYVFFPKKSQSVMAAEKEYLKVDDKRITSDKELKSLLDQYYKRSISVENLIYELDKQIPKNQDLVDKSELLKKEYYATLKKDKVFGFRNIKIFLGHLGMPIVSIALALCLLFLFLKEDNLFFRKVSLWFSIVGLISGLFYVIWVFYPSPDVPEWAYILLLFLFSIIGTVLMYFVSRYLYKLSEIDLVFKVQNLLNYINFDIKRKYINKNDREEYMDDFLGEIDKLYKKR